MRNLLSCLVAGVLPVAAVAEGLSLETWRKATVKIESFSCRDHSARLEGSGLLIREKQDVFILTSEHVVLHDQSEVTCHSSLGQRVQLVAADLLSGLALLKFSNSIDHTKASPVLLDEIKLVNANDRVAILGFSAGSTEASVLSDGVALTGISQRGLLAEVPNMIEAMGIPVEYGMSGGPILKSVKNSKWSMAGVVSHQVLKRAPGKVTKAIGLTEEVSPTDLTLAIPANSVVVWLHRAFAGTLGERPQRILQDQISGRDSFSYGPLQFKSSRNNLFETANVGGALTIIGGGDGAGVGGSYQENGNIEKINSVEISLADRASALERAGELEFGDLKSNELNLWRRYLLAGEKLHIPFLKVEGENGLLAVGPPTALLNQWLNGKAKPVLVRSGQHRFEERHKETMKRSRAIQKLLNVRYTNSGQPELRSWLLRVRDNCLLAENLMIEPDQLSSIVADSAVWSQLYSDNFEATVELEVELQAMLASLKGYRP